MVGAFTQLQWWNHRSSGKPIDSAFWTICNVSWIELVLKEASPKMTIQNWFRWDLSNCPTSFKFAEPDRAFLRIISCVQTTSQSQKNIEESWVLPYPCLPLSLVTSDFAFETLPLASSAARPKRICLATAVFTPPHKPLSLGHGKLAKWWIEILTLDETTRHTEHAACVCMWDHGTCYHHVQEVSYSIITTQSALIHQPIML